jgi:hypothetical protein
MTEPDPSRPRRGRFRRWIARVLRRLLDDGIPEHDVGTVAPSLEVTHTANRIHDVSFTTPAKGDAYAFTVHVDLCFCATGQLPHDRLLAKIDTRLPDVRTELKAAARRAAREHPVFRAGAAEPHIAAAIQTAVDEALAGVPEADGAVLTCTARVRVDMPDAVRELQRQAVVEQLRFEARYELSEQSARRLGELRVVWSEFIKDGLPNWETPYAVLMAQQPAQVAATLFTMRADRKTEAAQLVDTIAAVAAGHERMDLLEFALATDSALSKTYEVLGITRPEPGPASNFDERGEPGAGS